MSSRPGKNIFTGECSFVAGAQDFRAIPDSDLPEIAFAGRSNVGKSSLINALTGRKALARTSRTPGRTQQINFFDIGGQFMLVDLPGYGYASAAKSKVHAWNEMVRRYLKSRPNLKRVCVLIDSRHGLKDVDRESMDMLDRAAVQYLVVLTKTDQVGSEDLQAVTAQTEATLQKHPAALPNVFLTSSREKAGIEDLRKRLEEFIFM